jgi:hypothetical protein
MQRFRRCGVTHERDGCFKSYEKNGKYCWKTSDKYFCVHNKDEDSIEHRLKYLDLKIEFWKCNDTIEILKRDKMIM